MPCQCTVVGYDDRLTTVIETGSPARTTIGGPRHAAGMGRGSALPSPSAKIRSGNGVALGFSSTARRKRLRGAADDVAVDGWPRRGETATPSTRLLMPCEA